MNFTPGDFKYSNSGSEVTNPFPCPLFACVCVCVGKMIISLSLNITMNRLGGASVIAIQVGNG